MTRGTDLFFAVLSIRGKILICLTTVIVGTLGFFSAAYSCVFSPPGRELSYDELIDKSEVIFLMELECAVPPRIVGSREYCHTKIVEVVKGNPDPEKFKFSVVNDESQKVILHTPDHPEGVSVDLYTDFNGHKDEEFWNQNRSRSHGIISPCTPLTPFRKNELYLLFPNYFGAWKSGEVIRKRSDKWYLYVKERSRK